MEYKLIDAQITIAPEGHGSLTGYASTFGNWDSVRERPVKGAFAPHLAAFLKDGFIAVGHDWAALPVATPTEATEDDHGLLLKADFHSTQDAQAARTVTNERLARGKSVKLSIGYEVLQDEYVDEGRLLKEIKLYEVSLVTVPANPMAGVTASKGLTLEDNFDAVLAANSELARRLKALASLRAKESRVLSGANWERLSGHYASLDGIVKDLGELLKSTARSSSDDEKTLARVELELQRFQALMNGVHL